MTALKKISHLFLSGRTPPHAPGVYRPASGNKPLHSLLIADPAGRGIAAGFSAGLAQALSAKVSTVLLLSAGHAPAGSPLLMRYMPPESGSGPNRAETLIDRFRLGEEFDAALPALSRSNLLLITDAQADGRGRHDGYLHIIDTLIVLIGPDTAPEMISDCAASAARANPAIGLCICFSGDWAPDRWQAARAQALRPGPGVPVTLLGHVPAACAARQIVMGGRVVSLDRPDVMRAAGRAYQSIADNLLKARPPAVARRHAGDVLHALHTLFAHASPHLFMNSTPVAPCTKRSIP